MERAAPAHMLPLEYDSRGGKRLQLDFPAPKTENLKLDPKRSVGKAK